MEGGDLARGKKKAELWRAWIVFLDESGISQKPSVRRTWAPRGKTPVLRHNFNWKKLSICSVLGYRWDGTQSRLFFRIVPDSYNDVKLIDFLIQLRKEFRHRRLILLWDGLPSHRSRQMTAYLEDQRQWLSVVPLPAYEDLGEKVMGVRDGFIRIHSQKRLPHSFLKHAGLSFDRHVR